MCVPLPIIAAGTAAAGTLVGGVQSLMQGDYEAAIARRNAAMERSAAADSISRGYDEAASFHRDVGRVKGEQIAAMAANGIDVDYGTAARVQQDTADLARDDARNLYQSIHERTQGRLINAQNFVAEARAARWRGRQAMISSVFQAGSSLMSGMSQNARLRAQAKS